MNKYYDSLMGSMFEVPAGRVFKAHSENLDLPTGVDMLGSVAARLNGKECYLNSGFRRKVLITAKQDNSVTGKIDRTTRGKYQGAGLDSRAGILSLCMLLNLTIKSGTYDDVYFVATSLDHPNFSGSFVCAEKINPTIYINIGTYKARNKLFLGKGPVIINSPSTNYKIVSLLEEVAEKNKITKQRVDTTVKDQHACSRVVEASGGVACCEVCIPGVKDDTTGIWSVSKKDIENSAKLIHKLLMEVNKIESFLPEV